MSRAEERSDPGGAGGGSGSGNEPQERRAPAADHPENQPQEQQQEQGSLLEPAKYLRKAVVEGITEEEADRANQDPNHEGAPEEPAMGLKGFVSALDRYWNYRETRKMGPAPLPAVSWAQFKANYDHQKRGWDGWLARIERDGRGDKSSEAIAADVEGETLLREMFARFEQFFRDHPLPENVDLTDREAVEDLKAYRQHLKQFYAREQEIERKRRLKKVPMVINEKLAPVKQFAPMLSDPKVGGLMAVSLLLALFLNPLAMPFSILMLVIMGPGGILKLCKSAANGTLGGTLKKIPGGFFSVLGKLGLNRIPGYPEWVKKVSDSCEKDYVPKDKVQDKYRQPTDPADVEVAKGRGGGRRPGALGKGAAAAAVGPKPKPRSAAAAAAGLDDDDDSDLGLE